MKPEFKTIMVVSTAHISSATAALLEDLNDVLRVERSCDYDEAVMRVLRDFSCSQTAIDAVKNVLYLMREEVPWLGWCFAVPPVEEIDRMDKELTGFQCLHKTNNEPVNLRDVLSMLRRASEAGADYLSYDADGPALDGVTCYDW